MPRSVQKPRPRQSAANAKANDRRQQQLQSITKQKPTNTSIPDKSSSSPATYPGWLVSRLDALAELHATAWGGLEHFANSLADRGVVWYDIPGASDVFGNLDKASMLAFTIRRELTEGVESEAAA
jgi:hypothetical protein